MKLATLPKDKSQSSSLNFPVVKRNVATATGKKSNKGRSDRHAPPNFRVHGDQKGDASGSKLPTAPSGDEVLACSRWGFAQDYRLSGNGECESQVFFLSDSSASLLRCL
jgi:hypothetical protein